MKAVAAVQTGAREIALQEFVVPEDLGGDEALLSIEANGMCQTDYDQYQGRLGSSGLMQYPVIPGHETIGHLDWIGEGARAAWGLEAGARVAVNGLVYCGRCEPCRAGRTNFCPERFIYGFTPTTRAHGLWGGYSNYMVLRPNTICYPLPTTLSTEDAVLFNPLGAGFDWTIRAGGTMVGDTVVIIGPGQRGLSCVVAAAEAGAERIIVVGRSMRSWKLRIAEVLGATDVVESDRVDTVKAVREITGGALADRVIDTTPTATGPIVDALHCVRPEGTVVLAGVKGSDHVPGFDPDLLCLKAITVKGVFSVSEWAKEQAIKTLTRGRYDFGLFHTHTIRLGEVERALQILGGEVAGEDALHITVVP